MEGGNLRPVSGETHETSFSSGVEFARRFLALVDWYAASMASIAWSCCSVKGWSNSDRENDHDEEDEEQSGSFVEARPLLLLQWKSIITASIELTFFRRREIWLNFPHYKYGRGGLEMTKIDSEVYV